MSLPPYQPSPPEKPKLTTADQQIRQEDRLKTIRLRMAIGRELDEPGITTPAAIAAALDLPEAEATKLMTGRRWREGDVARGRIGWQKASSYSIRSRVEAAVGRYKQVIDDGLRFHKEERRTTEVGVSVHVLNRMLALGRLISVRIA